MFRFVDGNSSVVVIQINGFRHRNSLTGKLKNFKYMVQQVAQSELLGVVDSVIFVVVITYYYYKLLLFKNIYINIIICYYYYHYHYYYYYYYYYFYYVFT